jgi:hypothetical protein
MKTMKMTAWLVLILLLVSGTPIFAQGDSKESKDSKEQLVVPLSNPGKPYTLKVNVFSGFIKVTPYPGKEIVIDVVNKDNHDEDNEVKEGNNHMRRISAGHGYELRANQENNTVSVNGNNPEHRIDLNIKIPQDMVTLSLSSVNGGDIEVDNVKGSLEARNVKGNIRLTNISGSVVANTVSGNLTVTFASVDPKAPMAFATLSGNVDVTFPGDTKANFKMKSDRGAIYSDFEMAMDKTEPKVQKSEQTGYYSLKLEDWVMGKTNGGGAEIMMKTMQGQIFVRKGK